MFYPNIEAVNVKPDNTFDNTCIYRPNCFAISIFFKIIPK